MRHAEPGRRILLISSSTIYGSGYLDHAAAEIADTLAGTTRVMFIPHALFDRRQYASRARARLSSMVCRSIRSTRSPTRARRCAKPRLSSSAVEIRFDSWPPSTGSTRSKQSERASARECPTSAPAPARSWRVLHHAPGVGPSGPPEAAELAEVVVGAKPRRESPEEVTVFDSTGLALEDVAAAAAVYEKAIATGRGQPWHVAPSEVRARRPRIMGLSRTSEW